jgi:hypothetical protein
MSTCSDAVIRFGVFHLATSFPTEHTIDNNDEWMRTSSDTSGQSAKMNNDMSCC